MQLPVEHIHRENKSQYTTLILLLLPAIVFFLTISFFLFNSQINKNKVATSNETSWVLGDKYEVDK